MRILIAEDEIGIAKALKVMLEKSRYAVDMVHNGADALDYILSVNYDAIVLDIMMPGLDGLEVLKRAREHGIGSPVMFLTAKSDIEDRITGLDAGADDYLPKPFAMGEFLSRVRALTRRSGSYTADVLSIGNTKLDLSAYMLSCGEKTVRLNNKEFQLMELFMRNRGRVFSPEALMQKVWDLDTEAETDVVWTYIGFLRKKLRQLDAGVEIKTIRGAGYALEEK